MILLCLSYLLAYPNMRGLSCGSPYHWGWILGVVGRGRGGGATPSYKLYRYVLYQRVWFLCFFLSGNWYRLFPFLSVIGYGFLRELLIQFLMNKKWKRICCEFVVEFKKSFPCCSNLSNDDIISVYVNMYSAFFYFFRLSFGQLGGTPPPRILWSTLGGGGGWIFVRWF